MRPDWRSLKRSPASRSSTNTCHLPTHAKSSPPSWWRKAPNTICSAPWTSGDHRSTTCSNRSTACSLRRRLTSNRRYPYAHLRASRDGNGNGKNILGMPIRGHVQLMFYRKDMFAKLGLKPPGTWDEMVETGKTDFRPRPTCPALPCTTARQRRQNLMIWFNYLWGMGGDLLDAKGQPAFNSPAGHCRDAGLHRRAAQAQGGTSGICVLQRIRRGELDGPGQGRDVPGLVVALCRPCRSQRCRRSSPSRSAFAPLPSMPGKDQTPPTPTPGSTASTRTARKRPPPWSS